MRQCLRAGAHSPGGAPEQIEITRHHEPQPHQSLVHVGLEEIILPAGELALHEPLAAGQAEAEYRVKRREGAAISAACATPKPLRDTVWALPGHLSPIFSSKARASLGHNGMHPRND